MPACPLCQRFARVAVAPRRQGLLLMLLVLAVAVLHGLALRLIGLPASRKAADERAATPPRVSLRLQGPGPRQAGVAPVDPMTQPTPVDGGARPPQRPARLAATAQPSVTAKRWAAARRPGVSPQAQAPTQPKAHPARLPRPEAPGHRSPDDAAPAPAPGPVPPPAAAPAPPTRVPLAHTAAYRVVRGAASATAELSWQPEEGGYQLSLRVQGDEAGGRPAEWISVGQLAATGLRPQRHTERGARRSERAVNFEDGAASGAGGLIRYSGSAAVRERPPLAQDRLSWIAQLVAVASAWPGGRAPPGAEVVLPVAAAAGDLQVWRLQVTDEPSPGAPGWVGLRHQSAAPYETAVEVWLDPAAGFWPARWRLQDARGAPLEFERLDAAPVVPAPPRPGP